MAAKAASKSTTKVVKKASSQTKAKLEKEHDGLLKIGVDPSLVARAVAALLEHHKKTSDEKNSLLGNDRPVQVQFTLLRTPEKSSPKPIRVLVPHPLFKLADKDDGGDDSTEEPEICLIVKEESKPWCQEMIERFPEHMGCIKKVLGLQSLRKKHAQYAQRRELLNKYNVFMADDRILPMLTKALGKDFIKAKKQPVPINLTRKEALPFTIQKALSATYMTLSSGTCVMVKAGHTGMQPKKLVENIVEIAKNAVPKIPRKWANVQVISVKIPESVALPVYNKTPQILSELAKLSGYREEKVVTEEKEETTKAEDKASKKKKLKSPLLQALKKVDDEGKKKSKNAPKEKEEDKTKSEQRSKRKSSDADEGKKSSSSDTISQILDKKKKKRRSSAEGAEPAKEAKAQESQEKKDFIDSKKYKGSKKGYVFRAGIQGVGYYIDVKPVVDRAAMEALKRMGKGGKKKGRGGRKSY